MFSLMAYTIQNHYETVFKDVNYTQLFNHMKARHQARENRIESADDFPSLHDETRRMPFNSQWAKERDYDNDELFFSQDDDDEDDDMEPPYTETEVQKTYPQRKIAIEQAFPSVAKRKCKLDLIMGCKHYF